MKRSRLPVGVTLATAQLCGDGEWRSNCVCGKRSIMDGHCGKPMAGTIDLGFMRSRMCLEHLALFMSSSLEQGEFNENLELLRSEIAALGQATDHVMTPSAEDD